MDNEWSILRDLIRTWDLQLLSFERDQEKFGNDHDDCASQVPSHLHDILGSSAPLPSSGFTFFEDHYNLLNGRINSRPLLICLTRYFIGCKFNKMKYNLNKRWCGLSKMPFTLATTLNKRQCRLNKMPFMLSSMLFSHHCLLQSLRYDFLYLYFSHYVNLIFVSLPF